MHHHHTRMTGKRDKKIPSVDSNYCWIHHCSKNEDEKKKKKKKPRCWCCTHPENLDRCLLPTPPPHVINQGYRICTVGGRNKLTKKHRETETETETETEAYLEGLWRRVPNGSQEIGDGCIVEEDDRHTDRYQKKKEQASGPHSPRRRQASIPPSSSCCCCRPHSRFLPLLHGTSTSLSLYVCLLLSLKKPLKKP